MPRNWQYPRWRRHVMQAAMWVILGMTVGMAALVNHSRRAALRVDLSARLESGNVVFQLPATWKVVQPSPMKSHSTRRMIARAVEPGSEGDRTPGRSITIYRDSLDVPYSPIQYLFERESLGDALRNPSEAVGETPAELLPFTPIDIAGSPGVLIEFVKRTRSSRDDRRVQGAAELSSELLACAVLPSRQAVVVKLEGSGESSVADSAIIKQVAAAIELRNEPARGASGETISLANGIRVRVPEGLVPIRGSDPNRMSHLLWFDGDVSQWMSVELVPCVLLMHGAGDEERRAVGNIAAVRDRDFRRATVSDDGPRRWRIDPPQTSSTEFAPRRLYLISDDRGDSGTISGGPRRALLAEFHGIAGSEMQFDATWNAIASSVEFVGKTDFASMLTIGEAQAQRLMKWGLATLAEQRPTSDTWWLAHDPASASPVGFSELAWDALRPLGRRQGMLVRKGGTSTIRFTQTWSGPLSEYRCITETQITDGLATMIENEVTELDDGELRTDLIRAREKPVSWSRLAPAQFVPGAWLPALVGQLDADKPMILYTDSITGFEAISPTEPMALLIHASSSTAPDPSQRRALSIEINGSGQLMNWQIGSDGSLDRIDLAGGARRVRTDESAIREAFELDGID